MANSDNTPKISVIIPTFNRPKMLRRALKSLCDQTLPLYEVIVINDGKDTNRYSLNCCKRFMFLKTRGQTGAANSRNIGARKAIGQWLLFLDDDDELKPGYLQILTSHIIDNPDTLAFFSGASILTKKNGVERIEEVTFPSVYADTKILIKDFLSTGLGYGFCIKKDFFLHLGGFDTKYAVAEDTELFFRIIAKDVIPHAISGSWITKHEEHCSRLSSSFQRYADLGVYRKILNSHGTVLKKNSILITSIC